MHVMSHACHALGSPNHLSHTLPFHTLCSNLTGGCGHSPTLIMAHTIPSKFSTHPFAVRLSQVILHHFFACASLLGLRMAGGTSSLSTSKSSEACRLTTLSVSLISELLLSAAELMSALSW